MPYIFGMSLGSWILLAVIIVWAAIAIKVYFLGGFKKGKGGSCHGGGCCDTGDSKPSSSSRKASAASEQQLDKDIKQYCALGEDGTDASVCAACGQCDISATRKNAVAPIIKEVTPQH